MQAKLDQQAAHFTASRDIALFVLLHVDNSFQLRESYLPVNYNIRKYKARATLKFRKYANWSILSSVGTNPVSRLIVFAPIVAQILIYRPEVEFIQYLNLSMLDWAYWSLISFAAGQIIYTLTCPVDIKSYPNRHEFIKSLNSTETDERLRKEGFAIIRENFDPYGGTLILSGESLIPFFRDRAVNNMKAKRILAPDQEEIDIRVLENFKRLADSLETGRLLPLDWELIEANFDMLMQYATSETPELDWVDRHNLGRHIDDYATSSHWRVNLLDLRYGREKLSRPILRALCVLLYAIGMSYFLYSGLYNMLKVLSTYLT